jgi:class 3 adenylate cyclase
MTGGTRLVYDVWGETVTEAHAVARRAANGEILVTDTTRALLPESVELTRVEVASDVAGGPARGDGVPVDDGLALWSVEAATVRGSA